MGSGKVVSEIHTWFLAAVALVFSHIIHILYGNQLIYGICY